MNAFLITLSSRMVEKAFDETGDVKMLLDSAESEIFSLAQQQNHRDFVELKDILAESFERLDEFIKNGDGEKDLLEALHYKKIEVVEEMFLKKDSVRTAALQSLSVVYKTSPDVLEKILKDNL
jgi:replicative DNA helicase